jgi:hypothetical protein
MPNASLQNNQIECIQFIDKMQLLPNINLLAPISKHMWAMWGNVSKEEVMKMAK